MAISQTRLVVRGITTGRRDDGLGPHGPSRPGVFLLWGSALAGLALIGLIGSLGMPGHRGAPAKSPIQRLIVSEVVGGGPGVAARPTLATTPDGAPSYALVANALPACKDPPFSISGSVDGLA